MIETLLRVLETGLALWSGFERDKLEKQRAELEKDYWVQLNQPRDSRDDAALDRIEFELRVLARQFYSTARKPDAQAK